MVTHYITYNCLRNRTTGEKKSKMKAAHIEAAPVTIVYVKTNVL